MRVSLRVFIESACAVVALWSSACGDADKHTDYVLPSADASAADAANKNDFGNAGMTSVSDRFPGGGPIDSGPPVAPATGKVVSEFLADAGGGWSSLIEAEWELAANSEGYLCVRVTVPRDAYLHEFTPLVPLGTHHTVLTVHPGGEAPDGVESCGGGDVSGHQIYGAGVGTKPSVLPDGVAMQVHAGEQMRLNLHLFNSDAKPLKGRSGVKVHTVQQADVKNVAEGVLAGPLMLEIPPGGPTKQTGQCTFDHDATIFSVAPHMHKLGVHMKVTAHSSEAGTLTLFDGPYQFESQQRYPVDFVKLKAGDVVNIECTYQNDRDIAVSWGQSSLDEMCFAGIARYPASQSSAYLCMN